MHFFPIPHKLNIEVLNSEEIWNTYFRVCRISLTSLDIIPTVLSKLIGRSYLFLCLKLFHDNSDQFIILYHIDLKIYSNILNISEK